MKPFALLTGGVGLVSLLALPAAASLRLDPVTLDRDAPSIALSSAVNPASIYWINQSVQNSGLDIGGVGPTLHVDGLNLGLSLSTDHIDAMSMNTAVAPEGVVPLTFAPFIYFSVSAGSTGAAGTDVAHQAVRNQHAGDRFVMSAAASKTLPDALTTGAASGPGSNLLSVNHGRYNLAPTAFPTDFATGPQDDVRALEIFDLDRSAAVNPFEHDVPLFISLDAASPTLASLSAGPADILYAPANGAVASVFAAAGLLGLGAGDELDAVAVWDVNGDGIADPGQDFALFSLQTGSATLATAAASAADLFVTDFSGRFGLYLSHADLGLTFNDDLDALDVRAELVVLDVVPEPAALTALLALPLLARRRR